MKKRTFIKTAALAGLSMPFTGFANQSEERIPPFPDHEADEEAFWSDIRKQYKLPNDIIYLENGYYNILPSYILEKHIDEIRRINLEGSIYMRTKLSEDKRNNRKLMAAFMGVPEESVILTRNTTESMDTIIAGFPWQAGDEALMAEQDYGSMLDMFDQVSERHGVVCKRISIPNLPKTDEDIVSLYEKAITPKTKLIMICHIMNITGHILPVRKICDMAHQYGVEVLVDGAHAIGHFDFKLSDLNCDYYACSLHKWLSLPLGVGFLYIQPDHIKKIWPLFADQHVERNDVMHLNHTGTFPVHIENSLKHSIEFLNRIGGIQKKEKRLRYLKNFWMSKIKSIPGVYSNTPEEAERSCGIGNFGIKGMKPSEIQQKLLNEHKIYTVAIDVANVQGIRVTPGIFTEPSELEALVKAIEQIAIAQLKKK